MIDFVNGSVFKLSKNKTPTHNDDVRYIMIPGETIISEYTAARDFVVFTNKRIIAVNVKGVFGTKMDFTSLPYSKVQAFSVETAGDFDRDAELEIYFSGLGKVKFEFTRATDVDEVGRLISENIL